MEETIYYPKLLKEKCPKCQTNLYAWFHVPTSEFPTIGSWIVECNSDICDYRYEDEFANEDHLKTEFIIDNTVSADYKDATKIPKKSMGEHLKGKVIEDVIYTEDENQVYFIFSDGSLLEVGHRGFDFEEFYCEFYSTQKKFHQTKKYLSDLYKKKVGRIRIMNDRKSQ